MTFRLSTPQLRINRLRHVLLSSAMLAIAAVPPVAYAQADQARGQARAGEVQFNVPPQDLDSALTRVADQGGIRIFFTSAELAGLRTNGVSGAMTAEQALSQVLTGTGFGWRYREARTVVIEKLPDAQGAVQLGPVRVEGASTSGASETSGWSSDPSATEGTRSYASNQVSLAKGQSLREIPQSVSVITRQQIEDQGLADINEVMKQMPGVAVSGDYFYSNTGMYYARGFGLTNVQVDGVSDAAVGRVYSGGNAISNIAMYDHVEVLRGADGLYGGVGTSSGTINLARKRPLKEFRGGVDLTAGSWRNYGAMIDLTGPLIAEGRVRGRIVGTWQDRHYFYDFSETKTRFVYAIVETDVTDDTLLTLGGSYEDSDGVPEGAGFPTYTTGAFLGLPRSTNWTAPWANFSKEKTNLFADLEHRFSDHWKIDASINWTSYNNHQLQTRIVQPIDPVTQLTRRFINNEVAGKSLNLALDFHVAGNGSAFGIPYDVLLGVDIRRMRTNYGEDGNYTDANPINLHDVDPYSFIKPNFGEIGYWGWDKQKQDGAYLRLKFDLATNVHAILGGRYTNYDYPSNNYSESGILTPYAGLIYDFTSAWSLYGSIAKIYQSQANLRTGPIDALGILDPMEGQNYEIGVKGGLADGRITTSVALYRLERRGQAVSDPDYQDVPTKPNGCCFLNKGLVVSKGVEFELNGEVLPRLQFSGSYTYNHSKDHVANAAYATLTSPQHMLKLWGKYQFGGSLARLAIGGGVNYQSEVKVTGTNDSKFGGGTYKLGQPGYAVVNVYADYEIVDHWRLSVNLNNLFDKTYVVPIGTYYANQYGAPRNFTVSLRGRF